MRRGQLTYAYYIQAYVWFTVRYVSIVDSRILRFRNYLCIVDFNDRAVSKPLLLKGIRKLLVLVFKREFAQGKLAV